MRIPPTLEPLVDMGIIQEVIRPLMSGKEAQLYVVVAGGEERVAKVYKEANQRSFKQRADYTDGRSIRNSRDRRAINKRSRHGRAQDEAAWRSAEVDVIYRLRDAGVRVPAPYNFMDGVLIMEMITDADGEPAPRLGDLTFSPEDALNVFNRVLQEVVRMLCAGVVHGDLSEFNVLMGADGPVVIDFPQAVDPASNSGARRLLLRDVDNLHRFLDRVTDHRRPPFAQEMWALFERNELTPETQLRGQFRDNRRQADTKDVLGLIDDAARDEQRRRGQGQGRSQGQGQGRGRGRSNNARGGATSRPARGEVGPKVEVLVRSASGRTMTVSRDPPQTDGRPDNAVRSRAAPRSSSAPSDTSSDTSSSDAPPKKRRRRRRRGRTTSAPSSDAGSRSEA
ncbi:MAG: hypothetical protein JKY37_30110 [Nannocystaceae bacterium]|nr:hypothetical protein [Nannocystaceae bacterium]